VSPHSGKGLPLSREAFPARGRPPLDKVTRVTDRNMERRSGGSESGRQDPFQAIMHTIAARCRCKGGPFGLEVEQIGADGVPSLDAASPPWVGRWDFWTWRAGAPLRAKSLAGLQTRLRVSPTPLRLGLASRRGVGAAVSVVVNAPWGAVVSRDCRRGRAPRCAGRWQSSAGPPAPKVRLRVPFGVSSPAHAPDLFRSLPQGSWPSGKSAANGSRISTRSSVTHGRRAPGPSVHEGHVPAETPRDTSHGHDLR